MPVAAWSVRRTRASTPLSCSTWIASAPNGSTPATPTKTTGSPAAASQLATLAPAPPWRVCTRAAVSEPSASGSSTAAMTSVIRSPTTSTGRLLGVRHVRIWLCATAIRPARAALRSTMVVLTVNDRPAVSWWKRASR